MNAKTASMRPNTPASDPSFEFLEAFKLGSKEAMRALYDEHSRPLQRFLWGLPFGLSHQDVEDCIHDVFLRFFHKIREGAYDSDKGSVRAYLLGIARFVALDLCRRPKHLSLENVETQAQNSHKPRPEIQIALASLDLEQQTIITLRHINKLKMQELANCLDCSIPTARQKLKKAAHAFALALRNCGFEVEETSL